MIDERRCYHVIVVIRRPPSDESTLRYMPHKIVVTVGHSFGVVAETRDTLSIRYMLSWSAMLLSVVSRLYVASHARPPEYVIMLTIVVVVINAVANTPKMVLAID